jgi:L-alanine-DL-glutamate epimerase-like enolase superfamily enzyme
MTAGARIAAIDTVLHDGYPNTVHVIVRSDDGATGLGETFFHPEAVSAYVHTVIAPAMLGEPASNIASMWRRIGHGSDAGQAFAGFASVNSCATSAFDIAMWDLRARRLGLPLHEALGGAVRESIRLYNTCADPDHLPPPGTPRHEWRSYETWGLGRVPGGRYRDWTASIERPGELARELVDAGITAMKIYPFLRLRETMGLAITPRQLEENLEPFREIRRAVGDAIDVCVDLGSMWAPGPALQIAWALEPFGLMWLEDPLAVSSADALAWLAGQVRIPVAAQDVRAGLQSYADLIDRGGVAIVRVDPQWAGGVSEALRVAAHARLRGLPVAVHDCGGPVQWAAGIHCCLHIPNAMILESVRAYYLEIHPTMAANLPRVEAGHALPPDGPGHGVELLAAYVEGATVMRSTVRGGAFVTEPVP